MRTPLAGAFFAVAMAALLSGLALRSWPLVLLSLPPLVFLALGSLDAPARPQLVATRVLDRDRLSVGTEVEIRLHVVNQGPGLGLVEILDLLPPELVVVRGANHTIVSLAA